MNKEVFFKLLGAYQPLQNDIVVIAHSTDPNYLDYKVFNYKNSHEEHYYAMERVIAVLFNLEINYEHESPFYLDNHKDIFGFINRRNSANKKYDSGWRASLYDYFVKDITAEQLYDVLIKENR